MSLNRNRENFCVSREHSRCADRSSLQKESVRFESRKHGALGESGGEQLKMNSAPVRIPGMCERKIQAMTENVVFSLAFLTVSAIFPVSRISKNGLR